MTTTRGVSEHDQAFIQFYQQHPHLPALDLATRITRIATHFLDTPYQFEPLGEGPQGLYSTLPLYRADQFDCVTFVDTVLALCYAADFAQFKKNMLDIRYVQQQIDYTQRTDWFTDLEWNPTLQRLGYIKDVTLDILDEQQRPVAELAETIINKPDWYAQKIVGNLDLPHVSATEAEQRLQQLRAEGKKFKSQPSTLTYLPFTRLFNASGMPANTLWDQLPNVAVIEIARPNWRPVNPKDKSTDYGTHLNVTHLGIAVRTSADILFYHASTGKAVVCLPLVDYLRSFIDDERQAPVRGVHVEKILECALLNE